MKLNKMKINAIAPVCILMFDLILSFLNDKVILIKHYNSHHLSD